MPLREPVPETLQRVIAFSGVRPDAAWTRAVFDQEGKMWRSPDAAPMTFTARQWLDVSTVAFSWRARFPMMPLVALHVEDAYQHGEGRLVGRLWGWLRLFAQTGPDADRAQAIRYLSELAWAPAAYRHNERVHWEETAEGLLRASCEVAGTRVHVDYSVDSEGRVVSVRTEDRPRGVDGGSIDTPWVGRFDDWKEMNGLMLPTRGEVAWELPDGAFTYWRGRVTRHAVHD